MDSPEENPLEKLHLSLVVAMTSDGLIGKNGMLPWKPIPSDFKRFRKLTLAAGDVIMGSTTFRSIITRNRAPLAERRNIVLTRDNTEFVKSRGGIPVASVEEALRIARGSAAIIGGAQIYRQFLPWAQTIHETVVEGEFSGDARWQPVSRDEWGVSDDWDAHFQFFDERDPYRTAYVVHTRKSSPRA